MVYKLLKIIISIISILVEVVLISLNFLVRDFAEKLDKMNGEYINPGC